MKTLRSAVSDIVLLSCVVMIAGCASPDRPRAALPETGSLPALAGLPDPLVSSAGKPIRNRNEWTRSRKPELRQMFEFYEYGPIPPVPKEVTPRIRGDYPDFLGGKATLKIVTLECGDHGNAPKIDLLLVVPNQRSGPVPVFLAMNFCGNHALTADPRVPLTRGWLYDKCEGCTNNTATEAARGTQAADWPIETIISRGYAFAAFYSGDVDSDRKDVSAGIYAWLAKDDPTRNSPSHRGSIAAWAWGFHRCVDYLVSVPALDSKRIAAVGHSRNGKTALLAAAFDERIAMAFPNQAGCGGTAPSRGKVGESVKAINERFPHWFNARFKEFNESPEKIPFDQHCLMALCAPRPILICAATEDQWSNPAGQYEMAVAASPVYALFGAEGPRALQMPPPGVISGDRLAFHLRTGGHSMKAGDWEVFLGFADKHWRDR